MAQAKSQDLKSSMVQSLKEQEKKAEPAEQKKSEMGDLVRNMVNQQNEKKDGKAASAAEPVKKEENK